MSQPAQPGRRRCRIAVVGAGPLVGVHHCAAIAGLEAEEVELACVCQRREDDDAVSSSYGVPLYTDPREMARRERLDGVVIAAPTHLHLPIAKACIEGARERMLELNETSLGLRALLVEKPICGSVADALALVEAAEAAGVTVLVGHQRRHSPLVSAARDMVQRANFGPLRGVTAEFSLLKPASYFAERDPKLAWRSQPGRGGPILINVIHDVDLLRYITGHEVTNVFAATSKAARGLEVEDTGSVTVVLDHGAVGTMFFSDAAPSPWSYEFATRENKKYPPVPGDAPKDCYHFMGAQRSLGFPSLRDFSYGPEAAEAGWDAALTAGKTEVEPEDPIVAQMAHFVRVCRGRAAAICGGRDATESLAVTLAILRSAETGLPIQPGGMLRAEATALSAPSDLKAGALLGCRRDRLLSRMPTAVGDDSVDDGEVRESSGSSGSFEDT